MPLTRFKLSSIGDGGITTAKLADDAVTTAKLDDSSGGVTTPGVEYLKVPVGSTAQRPSVPADGMLRFNTDFDKLEQYSSATSSWSAIDTPPSIISLSYPGSITAVDPAGGETVTLTGTNFQSGAVVSIDGTDCTTSFVSSTSLTFVTPAKTAGDYDVVVTNSNGLTATLSSGISFNGTPAFSSPAAGKIGDTLAPTTTIPTITIVAAEADGGTIAYSITSGSLPTGLSLDGSSGEITGTTPAPSAETTYPFTVTATDDENQTSTRNYNLVVTRPVYNYQISNSITYGNAVGSGFLSRTLSGTHSSYTVSFWVKHGDFYSSSGGNQPYMFSSSPNIGLMRSVGLNSRTFDQLYFYDGPAGGFPTNPTSSAYDSSAWNHYVISNNNGVVTLYVNGVADASLNNISGFTALSTGFWWHTYHSATTTYNSRSQFAECILITGTAYTASDFGTDYNGIWIPKDPSGLSFGTDGCWLKFTNSSNFGEDFSGNNNDYTVGTVSGTIDADNQSLDTPTNNIACINNISNLYRSDGNLTMDGYYFGSRYQSGNFQGAFGSHPLRSGKWYFEVETDYQSGGGNWVWAGIQSSDHIRYNFITPNSAVYALARNWGVYLNDYGTNNYQIYDNGTLVLNTNGDVAGVTWQIAVDLDDGKMWIGRNNVWLGSGSPDPATGTDAPINIFDNVPKVPSGQNETVWYTPFFQTTRSSDQSNGQWIKVNFGRYAFDYTPPSGFKQISSPNMVDIASEVGDNVFGGKFEDHMGVTIYNGTGSGQVVPTTCRPDMMWIKTRGSGTDAGAYGARWFAKTRKSGSSMNADFLHVNVGKDYYGLNDAITATSDSSFTTGRVTMGGSSDGSGGIDNSARQHSAVYFKLGGDPVANTSGTITSQVSASQTIGISNFSYTGNASSGQSIGHGLSQTPDVVWTKEEGGGTNTYNWWVWTRYDNGTGDNDGFYSGLNNSNTWDASTPTFVAVDNTKLYLPTENYGNENGMKFHCVAFHEVPGFSKFGYYEANGTGTFSTSGPYINCGFKPRLVIIKKRDGASNWIWFTEDGDPQGYNQRPLYFNLSNTDSPDETTRSVIMTSNGFKIVGANNDVNSVTAGQKYFYMAFGENNIKYPKTGF